MDDVFTPAEEKRLREERATLWAEVRALMDGKSELRGEDATKYDELDGRIEGIGKRLDAGLKLRAANAADAEVVAERTDRTGTPEERHNELFTKWLRGQDMTRDERMSLAGLTNPELRVQNTLVGSKGGYLVPDQFWNRVVVRMREFGAIEPYVNVINTSTGADINWLTFDDTVEGELLVEGDQVGEADIAFGQAVLRAFTYSSKLIRVSWQLLQDSEIDVEGLIARVAALRLAKIHTRHFTLGTGINQPLGLLTNLTPGKTFAGAAAITVDELIDVQHSLDVAYRTGNQRWMFNDNTLKLIRKLAYTDGTKIWQPGLTAGQPDTILGDPYVINAAMPDPTTGNISVLYGDFNRGYIVRRVKGATAVRLDEKYADYLQTGYFVYDRVDGRRDEELAFTSGKQA